jgi:hypothetical protein
MNIAFLIPTTSKGKSWVTIEDTTLYKNTLSTFMIEPHYNYYFYIGYDYDDVFFNSIKYQTDFRMVFKEYTFIFIAYDSTIYKGHLTKMWNILLIHAINNNMNYFYQCGDDIIFKTYGWVQNAIEILHSHNDIGITGPINNHPHLLTQVFFSHKHYQIFKFLFPEYIFNWGCDDWINNVYSPDFIYPLKNHIAINDGGPPHYDTTKYNISAIKNMAKKQADIESVKLLNYMNRICFGLS